MDSLKDIGSDSVGQFGFHRTPQTSLPESLYQRAKENIAPDWQQIQKEGFGLDYPSLADLESNLPKNVSLSEIGQEGLEKALDLVTPLGVGTIIGPSARGFYKTIKEAQAAGISPMQTQEMAETLLAAGEPARLVTSKTGYYQDRFGNWKTQIDDVGTGPTKAVGPLFKNWKPSQKLNEDGRWPERQLEKVFYHPRLFEEYPWMRGDNVKVRFSTETDFAAAQMKIDSKTGRVIGGTIYLNPQGVQAWKNKFGLPSMNEAYRSMMLHEIQHVVQGIDNLPYGSSEDWFNEIVKKAPVIQKEINSLSDQIRKLPDNVVIKQHKIDRRDALQRHLDFMEANKDTAGSYKYMTTQGEMDAQWTQYMRDTANVKYRHPIQEDRGATYQDEGTWQPKFKEGQVALTSPAYGVTGTRPDTRPMAMLSEAEQKAASAEAPWSISQDFSDLLSSVKPSAKGISQVSELGVYHSSPHDFDAFDLRKVGTGEGASAYGHGVYLSESKKVQDFYNEQFKTKLESEKGRLISQIDSIKRQMNQPRLPADQWRELQQQVAEKTKQLNERDWNPKRYEVEIPDEAVSRMMNWDAPISEQPQVVQDMAKKIRNVYGPSKEYMSGGDFYKNLKVALGSEKAASDWLKKNGVPGLKYFDGDSRQATYGTKNFVIFDDTIPKITYKGDK